MDSGQLYGLEKFWAFLKYYKNGGNLIVQDRLKERVSKYKSIEDFRVEMVSVSLVACDYFPLGKMYFVCQ